MTNVFDVATYILKASGPLSAMKLQKLVYYAQAWSLVWDDAPLFNNRIEAWANGPVTRDLYAAHRGYFIVDANLFTTRLSQSELSENQKETIDLVLNAYLPQSAQWLSDQTHSEKPWINARIGLDEAERGDAEISLESMAEYYSSIK